MPLTKQTPTKKGGYIGGPANCILQLFYPFCLHLKHIFWAESTSTQNYGNLQSTTQNTKILQLQKQTN